MCDYSLQHVASRPAAAGQRLVTTRFATSMTRGFTEVGEPNVAICLLPGTEVAFDREVEAEPNFPLMPKRQIGERVARFRQVALDKPAAIHDGLVFANGYMVLLTRLVEGQTATVLQLPHGAVRETAAPEPGTVRAETAPVAAAVRSEPVR
jgi:hypothetical protein